MKKLTWERFKKYRTRSTIYGVIGAVMIVGVVLLKIFISRKKVRHLDIAVYWGQGGDSQIDLGTLCKTQPIDIVVISYVTLFTTQTPTGYPTTNFGNGCSNKTFVTHRGVTGFNIDCPSIVSGISTCQKLGKKILLSLGGPSEDINNSTSSIVDFQTEAINYAGLLWKSFGPPKANSTSPRPFGNTTVNGFNLDIETGGNITAYTQLVASLQKHFLTVKKGSFYISASPGCAFPDTELSDVIANSTVNYVWPRFFNSSSCGMGPVLNQTGNLTLLNWLNHTTGSVVGKAQRVFLGIEADQNSTDYATPAQLKTVLQPYKLMSEFGGVMLWDATSAVQNDVNNETYISYIQNIL